MKLTSTALALIFAASGAAQAQEVTYLSYGLGYTNQDFSGGPQLEVVTLNGTVEYTINQIYLMADLDADSFSGSFGGSEEFTEIRLRAGYQFGATGLVYVGVGRSDAFFSDFESFSVGGQYSAGALDVGLHYAEIIDEGVSGASLVVAYDVAPGAEVGLLYTRNMQNSENSSYTLFGTYEAGPLSVDASYQSLGDGDATFLFAEATYEFNDQFRAIGSIGSFDFGSNATHVGIGAGYQVAENMWIDASYSHIDGGFGDGVDTFGLAFTFETGTRATAFDRANEQRARPFNAIGGEFQIFDTFSEFGFGGAV